jgi:hypothetical protein
MVSAQPSGAPTAREARGGVNGPAPPGQRGREGPLSIVAEQGPLTEVNELLC